jgi:hypothetical protein
MVARQLNELLQANGSSLDIYKLSSADRHSEKAMPDQESPMLNKGDTWRTKPVSPANR